MKALSLKLQEDVFKQTDHIAKSSHISRNSYINRALRLYNELNRRKLLKKKLAAESRAVSASTLEVLAEMERLEENGE